MKRKGDFNQDGRKMAKSDGEDAPSGKPLSFAERMMLKMGHRKGEGLGKEGSGIVEPIAVKLRSGRVGLGAMGGEKTEQQKREERKAAERRGETYYDSEEEEREAEKRRRKIKKTVSGTSSGINTPGGGRIKQKYHTAADIEAGGLELPSSLKNLIDATGKETKLLVDPAGLSLSGPVHEESKAAKIAKRARRDVEAYAEAWNHLTEDHKTHAFQEDQMKRELDAIEADIRKTRDIASQASTLRQASTWEEIISTLEALPSEYRDETIVVAAVQQKFRTEMSQWSPLEDPTHLVEYMRRLRTILETSNDAKPRKQNATTPWETLIYTLWLPRVREAITLWKLPMTSAITVLLQAFQPLVPRFVYFKVVDQIFLKLQAAVQEWSPRKALKRKKHAEPFPHVWIFPFLPLLPESSSNTLLSSIRQKFSVALAHADLSVNPSPLVALTQPWRDVPGFELHKILLKSLLPALSAYFESEFEVDPSNQNLEPFLGVLQWRLLFSPNTMGELLVQKFFPKFLNILYLWLEGEPNYEEVGQFYQWWKEVVPQELNDLRPVADQWEKGLQMINLAIDGKLEAWNSNTQQRAPETPRPSHATNKEPRSVRKEVEEATFRDIVEDFCSEQNLILVPLREAHQITGNPLFRLTASVSGKGGVVVYIKGDVLYARDNKDKSRWNPIGLGDELALRAEGK